MFAAAGAFYEVAGVCDATDGRLLMVGVHREVFVVVFVPVADVNLVDVALPRQPPLFCADRVNRYAVEKAQQAKMEGKKPAINLIYSITFSRFHII